nr:calsequestrin-2 [Ciona intestinalis]|eukprot:XP_002130664.1 calsequestrin-2 [Ciona intestinalis]
MEKIGFLLLLLVLAVTLTSVFGEKGLEFPSHDGKDRLINLSKKNFNRFLKKFDILVVYFTVPHDANDKYLAKQWQLTEEMLELAAQITEREGVGFGVVDLEKDKKLAEKLDKTEAGAIYAYKAGHSVEFDGQRSTDVLVEFVLELDEYPVEEINSKTEVQGFRRDESTKVIGYFESNTASGYDEFVDAAHDFQPVISFYAVFQKLLARQLGLTELNQVDFYEPYMKKSIVIPGETPLDNTVIEKFVQEHKRATLRKLRTMDMYETWEDDINDIHVVAFADETDPEGFEFLQLLKEIAHIHTDDPNLSIVWIDPDDFTLLHDYWERTFGIDLSEPQIGIVNVTDADSLWMERRKSRLPTMAELEKWISDVLSGKINTEDDDDDFNLDDAEEDDDDTDGDDSDSKDGGADNDDDDDDDDDEPEVVTAKDMKKKVKHEL